MSQLTEKVWGGGGSEYEGPYSTFKLDVKSYYKVSQCHENFAVLVMMVMMCHKSLSVLLF